MANGQYYKEWMAGAKRLLISILNINNYNIDKK